MRKITLKPGWMMASFGVLGALVGGYFFIQNHVVDSRLRPILLQKLSSLLGSPANLGAVHVDLRGGVDLDQLSFEAPIPGYRLQAVIRRVSVRLSVLDLLWRHKNPADCLESITIDHPKLFLRPAAPVASAGVTVADAGSPVFPALPFKKIFIRDGELFFQSETDQEARRIAQAIHVQAFSDGARRWGLWMQAKPPEDKTPGSLTLTGSLNLAEPKLVGRAVLQNWSLASLGMFLRHATGWDLLGGEASVDVPFAYHPGRNFWFDLRGHVMEASVRAPGANGILFTGIQGRTAIRPTGLILNQPLRFQVGETPWQVSGEIPFDGRPVSLISSTDNLHLSTLFNDVLQLPNLKSDGLGQAAMTVTGDLLRPTIQGSASLGISHVGLWQLDSLALSARYDQGVFQLDRIKGQLYGGTLEAGGRVLLGATQEPVSLKASLQRVDAKQVATTLGLDGLEGTASAEVDLDGTLQEPIFSSHVSMDLTRTLRKQVYHYGIQNDIEVKDRKLTLAVVLNNQARLNGEFNEKPDGWQFGKLSMSDGNKTVHFAGQGLFPKDLNKPIQMEMRGQDIALEDLPFFQDQFPNVSGHVDLKAVFSGTREAPQGSFEFQSPDVVLGKGLTAGPLSGSLDWNADSLLIRSLSYSNSSGQNFSFAGTLGLLPDSPMDLKIHAGQMPLALLTEMTNLNNLPQPFSGTVTGKIHFAGIRKNPIIEGDGQVTGLQVGDWTADQMDALVTLDKGKLQVQKINFTQGIGHLNISGVWNTQAAPSQMALNFSAGHFQLGKGPYLTGDFTWNAQTGEPWWGDWKGVFSSLLFSLEDAQKNTYRFDDFSTEAFMKDSALQGTVHLGKTTTGSAQVDFSGTVPLVAADLKIGPVSLTQAPNLNQFLPAALKATGLISGELKIEKGAFNQLPLEGHFTAQDGKIQNYAFDRLKLDFSGDRSKIIPTLNLERQDAVYNLSGSLEAPPQVKDQAAGSFWSPDSRIELNGPFSKEKFSNLLSLLNLDTTGHKIAGMVDGNLAMTGTLGQPVLKFDLKGADLRFDGNRAPTADLHFSWAQGKLTVGDSQISLPKGQINIDQGDISLDPNDSSLLSINLSGSTDNLPIAILNLSSRVHLTGQVALVEKPSRPSFAGTLSVIDSKNAGTSKATPFDLSLTVNHQHIVFRPLNSPNPQLVGEMDFSVPGKIDFDHLHLLNSSGSFSLDGSLDLNGPCQLTSDAQNVPIQEIGKWFFPDFPLSGNGSYHLMLQGTLAEPVFNASFSVAEGKCRDLGFDLFSGDLKSEGTTLQLGSSDVPLVISKKGLYSFSLHGAMPFTFSPTGMSKIKNQEMDIDAEMDQGDFGLLLLTGMVKKASGDMSFSAHIGGTLDDPVLNMDLDLSKASLVPMSFAHSVQDINGRIKVRDNHVAVDDLNGLVGQGRVFIWTPPLKDSKMVLQNFIPQYLDFRIRTVGNRGLYLNIPGIMRDDEWGDIEFYGATQEDPMLLVGPISEPHLIGTALLQSGHYTFPPVEKGGKTVTYNALGNVLFDLNLVSGNDAWYSNDFAGQYLEVKIDPGDEIKITGKDSDKTPDVPGIKCYGSAGSKQGFLRYLGREFQLEEASLYIPKGKLPIMRGRATDTLKNAQIITAGGVRAADVRIWIDFSGTFGKVDFKLDSSPHLATTNDAEAQQQLLLSYIMFGRDMTGYTREDLQQAYQQNVGSAATDAALDAIDRISSAQITAALRPVAQVLGGLDVNVQSNAAQNYAGSSSSGASPAAGVEAGGTSLPAGVSPVIQLQLQKYLDSKFSVQTNLGMLRDQATGVSDFQSQFGLGYDVSKNLSLSAMTGQNDSGQYENTINLGFHASLPNTMSPNKNDKEPPKFVSLDIYPLGPAKVQVDWETDKVTEGEVRVLDVNGQLVKDQAEPRKFDYDHELVVDGLKPDNHYQIEVQVKDLNQNQSVSQPKDVSTPPG